MFQNSGGDFNEGHGQSRDLTHFLKWKLLVARATMARLGMILFSAGAFFQAVDILVSYPPPEIRARALPYPTPFVELTARALGYSD